MAFDQKEFERAQRTIGNWRKIEGGAGLGFSIAGTLTHAQHGPSPLSKPVTTAAVTKQDGDHIFCVDGAEWFLGTAAQ